MIKDKALFGLVILLIASVCWLGFKEMNSERSAFINIQEVYNGFEMKKEMEAKFLQVKNARGKILDSLELGLKIFASKLKSVKMPAASDVEEFSIRRDRFLELKSNYEADNEALSKKYDEEILVQLNQYVKDYGLKEGYTYIFGSDGNGSLMFAHTGKDISKMVIEFVNNKYKGVE